jgi:hypothetical protein
MLLFLHMLLQLTTSLHHTGFYGDTTLCIVLCETIITLELSKRGTAYPLDVVAISRECTPSPSLITWIGDVVYFIVPSLV